MSTDLPKSGLLAILSYGKEALTNRYKDLFLISFLFVFLPQLFAVVCWVLAAETSVANMNSWSNLAPLALVEAMIAFISSKVMFPTLIAIVMGSIGMLALARSSVDYFESRPGTVKSVLTRSIRVFLTKGIGVVLLFALIMPMLSMLPMLRAVALSLLLMLPVTLVTSASGGFITTWDTLTLRYAMQTRLGRWPVFINVLSINGLFLSLLFAVALGIDSISTFDVLLERPAGFLGSEFEIAGMKYHSGTMITDFLGCIWEALAMTVLMPFTAAIFHFATLPSDHVNFETQI